MGLSDLTYNPPYSDLENEPSNDGLARVAEALQRESSFGPNSLPYRMRCFLDSTTTDGIMLECSRPEANLITRIDFHVSEERGPVFAKATIRHGVPPYLSGQINGKRETLRRDAA